MPRIRSPSPHLRPRRTPEPVATPPPHASPVRPANSVEDRARQAKARRRIYRFTRDTLETALTPLRLCAVDFNATKALNDAWLEIDLDDEEVELAVVREVQALLGRRYKPLLDAEWRWS